jgi:hypothetical protein
MTSGEIAEPAPDAALYLDASSRLVGYSARRGHADVQAHVRYHARAREAIHLATCALVGATFLTAGLDSTICTVAASLGIPLI